MPDDEAFDVAQFATAYQELAQAVARAAPRSMAPFASPLQQHLGQDTTELAVVSMPVDVFDHPNLQRALDAFQASEGVELVEMVGIRGPCRSVLSPAQSAWPPAAKSGTSAATAWR